MVMVRYSQANFTAGELDPRTYARVDYSGYAKGCKRLRNALVIPQGGFQKRFGTDYVDVLGVTNPDYCEIWTMNYASDIIYLLIVQPLSIKIYFENVLVDTVTTTYTAEDIVDLRYTQVQNEIVIVHPNFRPRLLSRANEAANVISGVTPLANTIEVTTTITANLLYPVQFTTSGALPTTTPQIYIDRTYFAAAIDTNSLQIFATPEDASLRHNAFTITSAGTGTNNVFIQNAWSIADITFVNMPAYDFNFVYSALTFTPSAISGDGITLTASAPFFTAEMAGGLFTSGNQIMRFTTFNSTTVMNGDVLEDFTDTNAIKGSVATIGAPAWSNTRGWPRTAGFYQQRLVFAGSASIPNGVWLSVINTPRDFDDSDAFSDSGISYYTSSGASNYVRSITATESLVVHSNSGTYSTPLGATTPVTPSNLFLIEQNKDGVSTIQPVHIDNQIIYLDSTNNNVKNLQYDIIQSKYLLNNISVPSAEVVQQPTDMTSYVDPAFTDGSYVFFTNGDGSLAIFQTLIEQNIGAWSLSTTHTSVNDSFFVHAASSGQRCWFIVSRSINGFTKLYIEEVDFTVYTDCSKKITGNASATISGLTYLAGETKVQVTGDGNYLGEFTVSVGGVLVLPAIYSTVTLGLPIYTLFEPLPVDYPLENGTTLYKPKHIRGIYINYYQTYGATINGVPIPSGSNSDMRNFVLGQPPIPGNGVWLADPMTGWDAFDPFADILTIESSEPYPMTILGISYELEI